MKINFLKKKMFLFRKNCETKVTLFLFLKRFFSFKQMPETKFF